MIRAVLNYISAALQRTPRSDLIGEVRICVLVGLAAFGCFQRQLPATTCIVPPPCQRIRVDSVIFIGTVIDRGVRADGEKDYPQNIRVQVDEIFEGLPPGTTEVTVVTEGSWLLKGHTYLMDTVRGKDGHLVPTLCGTSADVTSGEIADVLDYLRQRAAGKAKTWLSVRVTAQYRPVPEVDVMIRGLDGRWARQSGEDGIATFSDLKPGKYTLTAVRDHYHADEGEYSNHEVDVIAGTCPSARVALRAESVIRGRVVDSKGAPVNALELELVTAPDDPSKDLSLDRPFFEATSNADGEFAFDSVSPGRYILGSNIVDQNSSTVPATFYPGQRTREAAYPIELKLGQTLVGLLFTLPDFGAPREIQVCVVDAKGKPVLGAEILTDDFEHTGSNFARLGKDLLTDESGCIKARGYTKPAYFISARLRPAGATFRETRLSNDFTIDPGEGPASRVLVLDDSDAR